MSATREEVPESLVGAERAGPIHEVLDDQVLVNLPGVARVLVRAGDVVGVAPAPDADASDVTWLLEGHVRQVAALQMGQFALRASAVVIDGQAVAICAYGGVGASAVAAGLANRGHAVLADGWLPVEGQTLEAPAITDELALWPDVAEMVGRDPDGGRAIRLRLAKRRHRFERGNKARLAAVVVLRRFEMEEEIGLERVVGGTSLELLHPFVALDHLVAPMGIEPQRFMWTTKLLAGCAVHRVELDRHRPGVDEPALAIEKLVDA